MALTKTPIELSSTPGIVDNSNATAITIDSSERVLIGKTATGLGASGTEINPNGYIQVTEDQSPPLYLNRLSTDGNIVNFYKDGSAKGSIGTTTSAGGSRFAIGAVGDPGIIFAGTGVFPATQITASDNSADLGSGTYRWKDIYLSGGAYLGGTAAANKLEDYEEGTWTPTDASGEGYSLTVNSATYTKIGRLVYITVYIDYPAQSSSADQLNGGLPFPSMSGTTYPQLSARVIDDTVSAQNLTFQITNNSTEGGVLDGASRLTNAQLSGKGVLYTGCYQTA